MLSCAHLLEHPGVLVEEEYEVAVLDLDCARGHGLHGDGVGGVRVGRAPQAVHLSLLPLRVVNLASGDLRHAKILSHAPTGLRAKHK